MYLPLPGSPVNSMLVRGEWLLEMKWDKKFLVIIIVMALNYITIWFVNGKTKLISFYILFY